MSSIYTNVASFDTTGYEGIGLVITAGALAIGSITNQATTEALQPFGVLTGGGAAGKPLAITTNPGALVQVKCGTVAITKGDQVKPEYAASLAAGAALFIPFAVAAMASGDWTWGFAQEDIPVGGTGYILFQPIQQNKLP